MDAVRTSNGIIANHIIARPIRWNRAWQSQETWSRSAEEEKK
jgi:hypothetical protein